MAASMHDAKEPLSYTPPTTRTVASPRLWAGIALGVILLSSSLLKLHNLGHLALKDLDESFHAIVAQNLLRHPLVPTLMEKPYLEISRQPTGAASAAETGSLAMWQNSHIWLHKPTLPLWQIALSYAVFGINTFALRLPSALLSTVAVYLTYLIGKELLDRTAGLIAAALQAFNPVILMLIHGYVFSDHIDVALLFWVEVAIYFLVRAMRTGRWQDIALAGVAQGLAFLSKTYPALIVTGVGLVAWLVPVLRLGSRQESKVRGRHVLLLIGCTILTIAPWTIYTAVRWPAEFAAEHGLILSHLGSDIEGWRAPWDRLVFEYAANIYYVFYTSVLAATVVLLVQAYARREAKLWVLLAWALGVMAPNLLAASKPPAGTISAVPAFLLLLGCLISRAIAGDGWALGAWAGATGASVVLGASVRRPGFGSPDEPLRILRANLWVLWQVGAALVAAGVVAGVGWILKQRATDAALDAREAASRPLENDLAEQFQTKLRRWLCMAAPGLLRWTLVAFAAAGTLVLSYQLVRKASQVPALDRNAPSFPQLGQFIAARLSDDAVLLMEEKSRLERNQLMFDAQRTTYGSSGENWRIYARQIVSHGGIPYLVTDRPLSLPTVFAGDGRTLYALTPAGLELRPAADGATTPAPSELPVPAR